MRDYNSFPKTGFLDSFAAWVGKRPVINALICLVGGFLVGHFI